jgi:hypothetical protein
VIAWSLMHVKYIYELCNLFDHIPLYLIVIYGPGHVLHCSGDFSKDPLYFDFNSTKQESLFFVFLF